MQRRAGPLVAGLVAALCVLAGGGTARAQHVTGIKVSVRHVEPTTSQVDVDITVLYQYIPATPYGYAVLGGDYALRPAIDWGDGRTARGPIYLPGQSGETFPGAPLDTGVFRGSFSHIYMMPGQYEIRVGAPCCPPTDVSDFVTGDLVTAVVRYPYDPMSTHVTTYLRNTASVYVPDVGPPTPGKSTCGLGGEVVVVLLPWAYCRSRRRSRSSP